MGLLDQISLEHVRVRGARDDAAVVRLRTSHLLGTARLQPAAMPPSAVLVVRSMADPLPGRIAGQLQSGATVSGAWERAAQDRLSALYARAARPAWGSVSSSADSVLFADYGELLGCLGYDVSIGTAEAWWWQSIRKRYSMRLPGSWTGFWEEHAQYIPSALEHLAARNRAAAVLERIAPVQAWRLVVAVARAFDLPVLANLRSGPAASSAAVVRQGPSASSQASRLPPSGGPPPTFSPEQHPSGQVERDADHERAPHAGAPGQARPPWEPYVLPGVTPAALGTERRALLGLGLLLSRAPAIALTREFSSRLDAWIAEQKDAENANQSPPSDSYGKSHQAQSSAASHRLQPQPESHAPLRHGQSRADPPGDSQAPRTSSHVSGIELPGDSRREGRVESRPDWGVGAVTHAGGILYLIHLLRQAELVRHFDTGLSGWALLELVTRCLLGALSRAIATDPIWDALAQLDKRDPHVPPGAEFRPQRTYTAPDSWLRKPGSDTRVARFRSRGIELWTPDGVLVFDSEEPEAPAEHRAAVPVSFLLRRRVRKAAEVRPAGIPISRELRRFLHFVLPYARWRLAQVLRGISLQDVLFRKGKLILSSSHVDLVMNMNQISVPVRVAGLDANPGWAPELGRVVTFHFVAEGCGSD